MEILVIIGGSCLAVLLVGGGMFICNGFAEKGIPRIKSRIYTSFIVIPALLMMFYTF